MLTVDGDVLEEEAVWVSWREVAEEGLCDASIIASKDATTEDTDANGTFPDCDELRMFIAMVLATAAEAGESSSGCWVSAARVVDVDVSSSGVGFDDKPLLLRL